jgi:hypothetical protein
LGSVVLIFYLEGLYVVAIAGGNAPPRHKPEEQPTPGRRRRCWCLQCDVAELLADPERQRRFLCGRQLLSTALLLLLAQQLGNPPASGAEDTLGWAPVWLGAVLRARWGPRDPRL